MSNAESNSGKPQTFWDHLEELRGCILRMLAAAAAAAAAAFGFKEELFGIVLAPADPDFITYRILGAEPFKFQLINTGLTEQFMIHLKTALAAGLLIASPYILYLLFRFVSPALYDNERRYSVSITLWAYAMFLIGVAVNYFVVFPLTVRFLGTYQVSAAVMNMLSISSYMDTLLGMSLVMGAVFEIPVISWLLARFGLLKARWMSHYRRHAIIVILILAAVITPTSDMFTMLIVSLPIWLLYEASIMIVRITEKKQ